MIEQARCEIAVIGAGVDRPDRGAAPGVRRARGGAGRSRTCPGSGASYGNAGTIADYAVMPVGTPDVLRNLPSLLFNRTSPLSIRTGALPALAPVAAALCAAVAAGGRPSATPRRSRGCWPRPGRLGGSGAQSSGRGRPAAARAACISTRREAAFRAGPGRHGRPPRAGGDGRSADQPDEAGGRWSRACRRSRAGRPSFRAPCS